MATLVGYTSRHGSTRDIAECIAVVLAEQGNLAEARPLAEVADPAGYEALVLGSPIHGGDWMPDAAVFLRSHAEVLAKRPVWMFSVGLSRAPGGHAEKAAKAPRAVTGVSATVVPREHRYFAGAIEPGHLPFLSRVVFRLMGGRYGDYRNWDEIVAWARGIAGALRESGRPVTRAPGGGTHP